MRGEPEVLLGASKKTSSLKKSDKLFFVIIDFNLIGTLLLLWDNPLGLICPGSPAIL
jgi:hypothetical protein